MFCGKCGNKLEDGDLFCGKCGAKTANAPEDSKKKADFDPSKAIASAIEGVETLKSDKKLLAMAGIVLAVILAVIMIIVLIAVNAKKATSGDMPKAPKGEFYFDRPLMFNQIVEFGSYEQDGNTFNGKEPIKWQVISVENDRYLLIAHNVLDAQPWEDGSGGGSMGGGLEHGSQFLYEDSSLRRWMNEYFDEEAFGEKEKKYIIPVSFRNDIITVSEGNEYARDYAFILSGNELVQNIPEYMAWRYCAPPTEYAISKGVYTVSIQDYLDNKGYSSPTDYRSKVDKALAMFRIGQPDFFDIGYVSSWYVRDTNKSSNSLQAYYTGIDNDFYPINASEADGVRPAIYITADACYKPEVEINEKLGSAVEKMSEYKGHYSTPDTGVVNSFELTISQGYFTIESPFASVQSSNEAFDLIYKWMIDNEILLGRYNMADYEYSVDNGNDCFTDYSNGMRFVYDKKEGKWLWYLNFPKGAAGILDDDADQWQFFHELVSKE